MKSRLYIVFIIIILFLISFLQSDFFYWLRIFNARPDFLLIICGLLGFYTVGKYSTSFLCSVFAGVSAGAFSSCPVFLFVFIYSISSFLGFIFRDKRYSSSSLFLLFFSCLLSLVSSFIYLIILLFLNNLSSPVDMFFYFVAQCFLNSLIIYPLACLIRLFTMTKNPFLDFKN